VPALVDADLEQRVAALVEARRPQLAELVRRAVDHELERLVAAELEQRNGNGYVATDFQVEHDQLEKTEHVSGTKVCTNCARSLPLAKFEAHRSKCRECRRAEARAREHEQAPAEEPPRTDVDAGA
jgi:hypothetical protein